MFSLAVDGGVYAGPRAAAKHVGEIRHGRGDPGEAGRCAVNFSDGKKVTGKINPKLSFHPSGVVNLPGSRLLARPLNSITGPSLLCHVAFQHPAAFATITQSEIKQQDVVLFFEVDETRPLLAWLHRLPTLSMFIAPDCLDWQYDLIFRCTGFQSTPEFILTFAIGPGAVSRWPPSTFLFVPQETGSV